LDYDKTIEYGSKWFCHWWTAEYLKILREREMERGRFDKIEKIERSIEYHEGIKKEEEDRKKKTDEEDRSEVD